MDYFQAPRSTTSSPPATQRPSRGLAQDSTHRSRSGSDRLSAPPSPKYSNESAPFKARPDDRTSLRQVFEPREIPTPIQEDCILSPISRPRLYRRTSSSINDDLDVSSQSAYFATSRSDEAVNRGRGSVDSSAEPRSASVAETPGTRRRQTLYPTPADSSGRNSGNYSPIAGGQTPYETNHVCHDGYRNIEGTNGFEGFKSVHHLARAHTHSGMLVPTEIRLRRATFNDVADEARRISVPSALGLTALDGPKPVRQVSDSPGVYCQSHKGSIAEPALTHTYVHLFLPSDPEDERRSSVTEGRQRSSATLQVVRSRDSVYEVIWEDEDVFFDAEESPAHRSTPASFASENMIPPSTLAETADRLASERRRSKTKMARWSWGGELEPYSSSKDNSRRQTVYSTPPESEPSTIDFRQPLGSSEPSIFTLVPSHKQEEPAPGPKSSTEQSLSLLERPSFLITTSAPQIPLQGFADDERDQQRTCSLTPSSASRSFNDHSTHQLRYQVLGKRKLSDTSMPEKEHFTLHRDSLVLAHKRIFREDIESAEGHVKGKLWHKNHYGHGRASAEPDTVAEIEGARQEIDDESDAYAVRLAHERTVDKLRRGTWHKPHPNPCASTSTLPTSTLGGDEIGNTTSGHRRRSRADPERQMAVFAGEGQASAPVTSKRKGKGKGKVVYTGDVDGGSG